MRELFDAIDRMDPAILIAALVAVLLLLTALEHFIKRQHLARATEYLDGYTHGYKDGRVGAMPAFMGTYLQTRDVPEAFRRGYR